MAQIKDQEAYTYLEKQDWHYDNGWMYQSLSWGAYVRNETYEVQIFERFPEVAIVRNPGNNTGEEIWRGNVETLEDLQKVIDTANGAITKK